ncbi:hypothetical protein [Roseovarius sp. MMSF_3350]|uniref:hypothetical protein n=1 Tax=Roseovarius sp. MMSF_3350 TaxID=3046706 RepID=UPI0027400207|nr:hypothetical protein [Roseovarius sp. MMSF_3350]
MSDEDKKKANAEPKLKPADGVDSSLPPAGHIGRKVSGPSVPGLGTSTRVVHLTLEVETEASDQYPEPTPEEKRAAYLEGLPEDTVFVVETGDEAIDQECAERGEVVVSEDEKTALQAAKETASKDEISASDFAKAFKRAAARSAELDHDKSKGPDLE